VNIGGAIYKPIATCAVGLLFSVTVHAAEIDGMWVNSLDNCTKVFQKENNRASFAKNSDLYGSGFIINGSEIRGKIATCQIKGRKDEGLMVNLLAECSTSTSVTTNQFVLRISGENEMVRFFTGMPDMELRYFRCD
jgi:hypothetical protein